MLPYVREVCCRSFNGKAKLKISAMNSEGAGIQHHTLPEYSLLMVRPCFL